MTLVYEQLIELGWDPLQPRDSRGKWTRFGGVPEAVKTIERNREGFSVSLHDGGQPVHGYMVALDGHTHTYPESVMDDPKHLARAIDDMLMSERESFSKPGMFLGGWVSDGKLWLDPSENITDHDTAVQAGRDRNQIAVWDLDHNREIDTGGSGGGRIIEHANPQAPATGAGGVRGPARGRAAGDSGAAGLPAHLSIAAQVLELGHWEGWRTEPRDRHGRWTRIPGENLLGEAYPHQYSDTITRLWRGEKDPAVKDSLNKASAAFENGELVKASAYLRLASNRSLRTDAGRSGQMRDLAMSLDSIKDTGTRDAVGKFISDTATTVPSLYGGHEHLDWDGKPPTIYDDFEKPSVLADMDWNGHMNMNQTMAQHITDGLAHPDRPIEDPAAFTVPLHELTHATVPAGQDRRSNGDMSAYQDYAHADIEEGFTELGTIQHASEYFDATGVGGRETMILNDSSDLEDEDSGLEHYTMSEYARKLDTPQRIRSGNAWGHYASSTAQAYNWVSMIAQQHSGKGEGHPDTQQEIRRLADEINQAGTAAKPRVMASQVVEDMGLDPGSIRESVLDSTMASILESWEKPEDSLTAARQAARQQVQRLQALQAERMAA